MAEIEDRITELKGMVTRFALVRSVQSSEEDSGPGNEAAVERMHQVLDDIAAAALGIELKAHEGLLRIKLEAVQDLLTDTVRNHGLITVRPDAGGATGTRPSPAPSAPE